MSMTMSKGSIKAAACGTGITRANIGTATTPAPPANPDLEMPVRSTPTIASNQNKKEE